MSLYQHCKDNKIPATVITGGSDWTATRKSGQRFIEQYTPHATEVYNPKLMHASICTRPAEMLPTFMESLNSLHLSDIQFSQTALQHAYELANSSRREDPLLSQVAQRLSYVIARLREMKKQD